MRERNYTMRMYLENRSGLFVLFLTIKALRSGIVLAVQKIVISLLIVDWEGTTQPGRQFPPQHYPFHLNQQTLHHQAQNNPIHVPNQVLEVKLGI
jgi:hypothetical protein